ncbi:multidrug resistance protein [Coccidioides immitis RS]|uniref:Multidrug resistance protein n=2 Tax=Coccidioides immitis TaxID=5501 RepID=A0A0E1RXL1_COCIM|nr:multidrug resistance protein [Coccidioides immitis RS]EAS31180.2 multidrug resistance protein [Coccidioides immitis RS]KMU83300.1 benomyl/methotrexate resistance protein [Coccidioides immitis H538.4]
MDSGAPGRGLAEEERRGDANIAEKGMATEQIIVKFEPGDKDNPHNWSMTWRLVISGIYILLSLNSTLGSSMPAGAIKVIAEGLNVTNKYQLVLPISVFLIGYIVGPLFLAPLSEVYGRRPLLLWTFVLYLFFTLGTALVSNFPGLLILRFFAGTAAAAPLAIVGGVFADCFPDSVHRGRVMSMWAAGTIFGPTLSPLISGFLGKVSWRWPFWLELIFGGFTLIPMVFVPETFGPVILAQRAARIRKELKRDGIIAPGSAENVDLKELFAVTLSRPVKMLFTEPIVPAVCSYMAYVYAILYLFFQAYPIIFQDEYGMSPGIAGLAYLPVGVGSVISAMMVVLWDERMRKRGNKKQSMEYHRLTLACIGGPLIIMSLFWLGWTGRRSVHWIVPILAGLLYGTGNTTIFMALFNYLTDAYGIYSASAMAAGACTRSISGALLPLAAKPMYERLGIGWASSVLGLMGLPLVVIPFLFLRYGQQLRARSPFCAELARRKMEEDDGSAGRGDSSGVVISAVEQTRRADRPAA